jgi:hypothetical protein
MQRYEACSIGHRRLRSRGLNPDNPVTPLVDSLVLSEHLWGNAEQAFDARLSTWRALRGPKNFARFARRRGIPLVRFGARVRVRRSDIDNFVLASLCVPNPTRNKEQSNEAS